MTQAVPGCASPLARFYNNFSFGTTLHFTVRGGTGTWCDDGQPHSYSGTNGTGGNAGETSIVVTQLD